MPFNGKQRERCFPFFIPPSKHGRAAAASLCLKYGISAMSARVKENYNPVIADDCNKGHY